MPRISAFYGITIWMYWNEGRHARPHFHARYSGQGASVDFDGELVAGRLPRRALAMVRRMGLGCVRMSLESQPGRALARTSRFSGSIDPLP